MHEINNSDINLSHIPPNPDQALHREGQVTPRPSSSTPSNHNSHYEEFEENLQQMKQVDQITKDSTPREPISTPKLAAAEESNMQLCILSNQKYSNILKAVEYAFQSNTRYCHYVIPNGGITNLLTNLEKKLDKFTMADYCVIYIGEQDLNRTVNIIQLVNCLRESLKKITHTSKIICLPTYICGALIYNYKVELFGNLLAMDMQSNDYAYLFDTNRNLTLDMFSHHSGRITNFGIRSVFSSLKQFIIQENRTSSTLNMINTCVTEPTSPKFVPETVETTEEVEVLEEEFFRE